MSVSTVLLVASLAAFKADDLPKLEENAVKRYEAAKIVWVADGAARLPIVCMREPRGEWSAARWLQEVAAQISGVKPKLVACRKLEDAPKGPAIFIGDKLTPPAFRGADAAKEEFRVVSSGGSLYFTGKASFGVYDFAMRALDVRQYGHAPEDCRCVVKSGKIVLPEIDYSDKPVFKVRTCWPYSFFKECEAVWKSGCSHNVQHQGHVPHDWWKDTNYNYRVTRPEIFQLNRDGQRCTSPMLCFSNPKTFETYRERVNAERAGGPSSGVINVPYNTLSLTQWDAMVDCRCETCLPLYDERLGLTGNASPIIWGVMARRLSDYLAKEHPDLVLSLSPYLNTVDCPEGLAFPAGNTEVSLCKMPGLAMLKDESVRKREEGLIDTWYKASGRPLRTSDFLCWPAEYCSAPYVFGKVIQDHYRRVRGKIVGSFVNGVNNKRERITLSAYVWMMCLWNPEFDLSAVYDGFASRMFGKGAGPMREIIRMQEEGWLRPWGSSQISAKNIFEVSYPKKDVLRMQELFAEAKKLAALDALSMKRIAWYESGFAEFFKESAAIASGTALEDSLIKKVASNPVVDGRLDDDAWKAATAHPFVHSRERRPPTYPTFLRMVWTPNGVTLGFHCTEPLAGDLALRRKINKIGTVEYLDCFIDVSGTGDGNYYQILMDDAGRCMFYSSDLGWKGEGVRSAIRFDKDHWEAEIFIPFSSLKNFPSASIPSGTSSDGKSWIGNFCRSRYWDIHLKKSERIKTSVRETLRRYTRYSVWNKDPAAFGRLRFTE